MEASIAADESLKTLFLRGPQDFSFVFGEDDVSNKTENETLPPQINSMQPGSFARDSLVRRIPEEIIGRVLQENEVYLQQHPSSKELLLQLQQEMRNADTTPIRPLECFEGPPEGAPEAPPCRRGAPGGPPCGFCRACEERDLQMWNGVLLKEALEGGLVLSKAPWILSEVYCYRRMLHAFDFFETLYDPFARQKLAGLAAAAAAVGVYGQQVVSLLQQVSTEASPGVCTPCLCSFKPQLKAAVFASLEGNAGDLSLWPKALSAAATEQRETLIQQTAPDVGDDPTWLLAGDFEAFFSDFCSSSSSSSKICSKCSSSSNRSCSKCSSSSSNSSCNKCSRVVHLWTDNAGEELLADLLLCSCLLLTAAAQRVRLCVKQQPTYVSDATKVDVEITFRWLEQRGKQDENLAAWASLLRGWQRDGRLIVSASFFCCSPLELRQAPKEMHAAWEKEAALLILKGDMNYRRLLGDREWPRDEAFTSVVSFCCTRVLALRLLKAEIGCGMSTDKMSAAAAADPKWMVNGKWGVMQYFTPFPTNPKP